MKTILSAVGLTLVVSLMPHSVPSEMGRSLKRSNVEMKSVEVKEIKPETLAEPLEKPEPVKTQVKVQTASSGYSGTLSDWLLKLRMCESGGNYQTNTGNGYFGAYQFSIPTWNSHNTGYARADLAPPAVQDATIIKNTNASAGLSTQNPGCYASQGLSNKPPS